jgi:hypothetical protein
VYVRIGGIEQWLQLNENKPENPVLLYLHGGPGGTSVPAAAAWKSWENHFTVIHWDQRTSRETVSQEFLHILGRLWTFPSMEGLGLGFVANHFDVVPVRTNDESCIVVRVVVRAQTRRTIVFATRLQCCRQSLRSDPSNLFGCSNTGVTENAILMMSCANVS